MAEPSFSVSHLLTVWRIPTLLLVLLVVIVSGCESRGTRTGQISIDRHFTTGGFAWDSGSLVYVFVKVRENQGKVEVCAAYMPTPGSSYTVRLDVDVLDAAIVIVDGVRVMRGLAFANPLPLMDDVVGQTAACARGQTDWKPSYARASVEVKFPRMKFG